MARTNSHTQKKFGKTRLIRYKRTNVWRSVEKTTLLYELTYRETLRKQSCIKQATNLSHFTGNKEICLQNFSSFLVFGHHVRPYGEIGRTISKFGRTMSDDRLLFPALLILSEMLIHIQRIAGLLVMVYSLSLSGLG